MEVGLEKAEEAYAWEGPVVLGVDQSGIQGERGDVGRGRGGGGGLGDQMPLCLWLLGAH